MKKVIGILILMLLSLTVFSQTDSWLNDGTGKAMGGGYTLHYRVTGIDSTMTTLHYSNTVNALPMLNMHYWNRFDSSINVNTKPYVTLFVQVYYHGSGVDTLTGVYLFGLDPVGTARIFDTLTIYGNHTMQSYIHVPIIYTEWGIAWASKDITSSGYATQLDVVIPVLIPTAKVEGY